MPDNFDKFLKKYYPQWRDPQMIERDKRAREMREAEKQRALREAAEIVALDPVRAAKRRELGLDP